MFQHHDERVPVAVLTHPDMAHHGRDDHDEHPGRYAAILAGISRAAASGLDLRSYIARPATESELSRVHTSGYCAALASGGMKPTPDNPITAGTWTAALLAAGAAATASDCLALHGLRRAFCAIRPPGHHAHADRASGFCYLNNAVIAAQQLRHHGAARVAIIDIDYHHGDGTAALVTADPALWYASVHADPTLAWPGTGLASDHPRLIHYPIARPGGDGRWLAAVAELIKRVEAAMPTALVISFGSDALAGDPVGDLGISQDALASAVRRIVSAFPNVPIISVLEGGYDETALSEAVARHLHALAG